MVVRKPVMSTPDVRFQDPRDRPVLRDGLPRRRVSTVAALSSTLVHENHRVDGAWSQTYHYGVPVRELTDLVADGHNGTTVTFTCTLDGPAFITAEDVTNLPWLYVTVR